MREWISNQTSKPLQFPDGDCVVIFDNNQVIGRSWNIKVNHKTKSSVVTTICQLQYDGYHNIQRQPQLKPYLWLRNIDFIRDNVRIICLMYIIECCISQLLRDSKISSVSRDKVQTVTSQMTLMTQSPCRRKVKRSKCVPNVDIITPKLNVCV